VGFYANSELTMLLSDNVLPVALNYMQILCLLIWIVYRVTDSQTIGSVLTFLRKFRRKSNEGYTV